MDILTKIAEEKIREAMQKGEFDNLPGKGKPLKMDDLAHVPEELRAGYIILKNAGVLPEEMQLKKEIVTLQQLLNCCYAEEDQLTIKKKLSEKILRFNILMERRKRTFASLRMYREKIYRKLGYRDLL